MGEDQKLSYIFNKTTKAEKLLEEEALKEKCRILIENAKEKRAKESDNDDTIYYYFDDTLKELIKDDSKGYYKKAQDKIEKDYFKTYISNIISEEVAKQVEEKVKEEIDKRLGKEEKDKDCENYLEEKYYFRRNVAKNNYYRSYEQTDDVKKALEDYILLLYGKYKEETYDFTSWDLKSNVKEILEEKGLKQSWLQGKTQIPISTLRSILNNEKTVSLENAYKISIVMSMPLEKLFSYIDVDKLYEDSLNE